MGEAASVEVLARLEAADVADRIGCSEHAHQLRRTAALKAEIELYGREIRGRWRRQEGGDGGNDS